MTLIYPPMVIGTPLPKGVVYDGTNDYLQRTSALVGASVGSVGTLSCWVKMNGSDGAALVLFQMFAAAYTGVNVARQASKKLLFTLRSTGNAARVSIGSTSTLTADASWHHVAACWDTSSAALCLLYLDGLDDTGSASVGAGTIGYVAPRVTVGADRTGGNKMNCDMAEFWFDTSYVDLTDAAERAKFLKATGTPASLGNAGQRPTGAPPLIYLKGPASTWGTNYGTGGDFTVTGSFTDSATKPRL